LRFLPTSDVEYESSVGGDDKGRTLLKGPAASRAEEMGVRSFTSDPLNSDGRGRNNRRSSAEPLACSPENGTQFRDSKDLILFFKSSIVDLREESTLLEAVLAAVTAPLTSLRKLDDSVSI